MIRLYKTGDKNNVINLLRLNTPQYFDPSEENDFVEYLDNFIDSYFVVEEGGQIIGCGGINYFKKESLARIAWDIIHPDFQGKGIGRKLTQFRIKEIRNNSFVKLIVVRTTQLAFKFYKKIGFVLDKKEKNFWTEGFDLYQMEMVIG